MTGRITSEQIALVELLGAILFSSSALIFVTCLWTACTRLKIRKLQIAIFG
jgi:uncharacterized membrane protein